MESTDLRSGVPRRVFDVAFAILVVVLCVVAAESVISVSSRTAKETLAVRAQAISDGFWSYDEAALKAYLSLAAACDQWSYLGVTGSGEVITAIGDAPKSGDKIHRPFLLMRTTEFVVDIESEGQVLGSLVAVWSPAVLPLIAPPIGALAFVVGLSYAGIRLRQERRVVQAKNEDLHRARIEILESERQSAIARVASGLSHEINTPLGIIVTANSTLESNVALFEKERGDTLTAEQNRIVSVSLQAAQIVSRNVRRLVGIMERVRMLDPRALQAMKIVTPQEIVRGVRWLLQTTDRPPFEVKIEADTRFRTDPSVFIQAVFLLVHEDPTRGQEKGRLPKSITLAFYVDRRDLILEISEPDSMIRGPRRTDGLNLDLFIVTYLITATLKGTFTTTECEQGRKSTIRLPGSLRG